jgi:phage anti-repressor protein
MAEYGFKEGIDFSSILSKSTVERPSKNYIITLNMAKELSII